MSHVALKVPLPKPAAPVEKRELSVVVNGDAAKVYVLPGGATETPELLFHKDDSYQITLTDIGAGGHRSQPSPPFSGAAAADMQPARPAELGPVVPAGKRLLNDEEAKQFKAQAAEKEQAEAKSAAAAAATDGGQAHARGGHAAHGHEHAHKKS